MADFKNYSFQNVNCIWGIILFEQYAEGDDVVNLTYDADLNVKVAGAKGDVLRVQTSDSSCTVVVKLLQTSSTNKLLTAQYLIDRETGLGVFPFVIENKEAGEKFIINNAWIQKFPSQVRGQGPNATEWTLQGDFCTPIFA